jgi:hypothetical protein
MFQPIIEIIQYISVQIEVLKLKVLEMNEPEHELLDKMRTQ